MAQGFSQIEGVNYFETFAPVVNFNIILLVISLACHNNWLVHHVDFDAAYLNAQLDEKIFMRPPKHLQSNPKFKDKLLLLNKSLYGLKQAGREWYKLLTAKLKQLNWLQSIHEPCLFVRKTDKDTEILLIYVDDILIVSPNNEKIQTTKRELGNIFKTKDLHAMSYFLNINFTIDYKNAAFQLHQNNLLNQLIPEAKVSGKCRIPMNPKLLDTTYNICHQDRHDNQSKIGSLLYLSRFTRPDIAFSVSFASRSIAKQISNSSEIVKNITKYLATTKNLALNVNCHDITTLHCFSDADYASDEDTRCSTSGYAIYLGDGLISWKSSKQRLVAQSTMESEFIALNETLREALAISYTYKEICGFEPEIVLYCDNNAAKEITENPKYHGKAKHIETKYHFIRQYFESGRFSIVRIDSKVNPEIQQQVLDRVCHFPT